MPTVSNTLYPPIVSTYMPAFPYNENAVIYFSISTFNKPTDIEYVHVSLVDQRTNENAFYINGQPAPIMVYKMWSTNKEQNLLSTSDGLYKIEISKEQLKENFFNTNQYYKVQLRFDTGEGAKAHGAEDFLWSEGETGGDGYVNNINRYLIEGEPYFSEWSTVCLIRPILIPQIELNGNFSSLTENIGEDSGDIVATFEPGDLWVVGKVVFEKSSSETDETPREDSEALEKYTISIVDKNENVLVKSKTIYPLTSNLSLNEINTTLSTMGLLKLENTKLYIKIDAVTTNGYTIREKYSEFILGGWENSVNFSNTKISHDKENGRIKIKTEIASSGTEGAISEGKIIIRRTDDLSNFEKWDLIRVVKVKNLSQTSEAGKYELEIEDNTVGSMNWYKYYFQYANEKNVLSKPHITNKIYVDFEYAIFSRGKTQLSVKYDFNISSYKPVVSRAKIDTLGGKYPKFAENAVLGYKQFSISGKIAAQEDEYELFISKNADMEKTPYSYEDYEKSFASETYDDYYKKVPVNDDALHGEGVKQHEYPQSVCYEKDPWLEHHDWLWERKFREAAIAWLNDGEPKLMRTLTEGNVCVMLMDVNLTPEKTLYRRIYDFTATAYEVGNGYDLETLDALGIYEVKDETEINYEDLLAGKVDEPGERYSYIGNKTNFSIKNEEWYTGTTLDIVKYLYDLDTVNSSSWMENRVGNFLKNTFYITDVKIQFLNPPHVFRETSNGIELFNPSSLELEEGQKEPPLLYGYQIKAKVKDSNKDAIIFVNSNGYYQFPDGVEISSLTLPQMNHGTNPDIIDINYQIAGNRKVSGNKISAGTFRVKTLVAQERRTFDCDTSIKDYINDKHYFSKHNADNGTISYIQKLSSWAGVSVEANPYTVMEIIYDDDFKTKVEIEIGQSGYFNMFDKDVNLFDIKFLGRRIYPINSDSDSYDYDSDELIREHEAYVGTREIERNEHLHALNETRNSEGELISEGKIAWNGKIYPYVDGIAKIPVDAIINYTGTIDRQYF